MKKMSVLTCSLILAASVNAWAQELPTTAEVFRRIDEAASELTTYSFEFKFVDSGFPLTYIETGKHIGRVVRTDRGQRYQFRETSQTVAGPDPEEPVPQLSRTHRRVCDGETLWLESTETASKDTRVTKRPAAKASQLLNPVLAFTSVAGRYDLSLVGEETVNDEEVYVLAGKLMAEFDVGDLKGGTCVVHVGKKDLLPRMILRKDSHFTITTEFKNWRLDVEVDDEVFKYSPPQDVEVKDETKKEEQPAP